MNALYAIKQFSESRLSWLILLISIVALEATALYFQHVMMLAPCVMCIYERVAMMGVGFAAILGMLNPKNVIVRWLGFLDGEPALIKA